MIESPNFAKRQRIRDIAGAERTMAYGRYFPRRVGFHQNGMIADEFITFQLVTATHAWAVFI
jgi:predicted NAD/FAD-binding protein